jgi:hypothetical protein
VGAGSEVADVAMIPWQLTICGFCVFRGARQALPSADIEAPEFVIRRKRLTRRAAERLACTVHVKAQGAACDGNILKDRPSGTCF